MASEILNQINISCYTEYKMFGPSLIYNTNYQVIERKSENKENESLVGLTLIEAIL